MRIRLATAFVVLGLAASAPLFAAESKMSITPEVMYIGVNGDSDKFAAHHWVQDGWTEGIREFTLENEDIGNDVALETEGRFLYGNGDYGYELLLKKEDVGFLRLGFDQFRKYYDSTGGVFSLMRSLPVSDSNRDLFMDIGKFELEAGWTPPDMPDLIFLYEHEYKNGTKSTTMWTSVTDAPYVKKIGPSWIEIDEAVDVFQLTAEDDWKGLQWLAQQKWEHHSTHSFREEANLSTSSTASDSKIRDQILEPTSDSLETTFEGKKWLVKDTLYGTAGYRFGYIENSEVENIIEMTAGRVVTNAFSNAEQIRDAVAANQYRTHTGVATLTWMLTKTLSATTKLKGETINRDSHSHHPADKSPATGPDGFIDQDDVSENQDDAVRWGEGLSLRFTGIDHLALYNETELEQVRNNLVEDRTSSSSGEVFNRQTISYYYRGSNAIGFQYFPNEFLTLTTQYRHRQDNIDYDDLRETVSTASGSKSAFVDGENNRADEVSTRAAMRFNEWLRPSVRYVLRDNDYNMHFEGNPLNISSRSLASMYIFDLPLQPTPQWSLDGSFGIQDAWVHAADDSAQFRYPGFDSDVYTWTLDTEYAIDKDLSATGSFVYEKADNYINNMPDFIPYGADYDEYNVAVGLKWTGWRKGVTIEPKYSFFRYAPNQNVEYDHYNAHVALVSVTVDWA